MRRPTLIAAGSAFAVQAALVHAFFLGISVLGFLYPSASNALLIDSAGVYVIDSRVDEVLISDILTSRDVSIEVISGGVVEGDIRCLGPASDDCEAQVGVSGHGAVLGFIRGADANVTLQDYARVGRAGAGSYTGAAVYVSDNAHLDAYQSATNTLNRLVMTGGYVGENIPTTETVQVDISGGTIGSFHNSSGLVFNMTGGRVLDGLSADVRLKVTEGEIWGGVHFGSEAYGHSYIGGGAFNANADEYLLNYGNGTNFRLVIEGGLFGNINAGSGIYLSRGHVDIWGTDLLLDDGLLTGYLLDGNYISVPVGFSDNWAGDLNLINVPEPSSYLLMGIGLAGMGLTRRRRRKNPM